MRSHSGLCIFFSKQGAGHGPTSGMSMIAEDDIKALNAWLAKAGLRGEPEAALVNGFCERAVAASLPISRALLLIDTLHPVYEGRMVRWGYAAAVAACLFMSAAALIVSS